MLKELSQEYSLFAQENVKTFLEFLPLYIRAGFVFDDPEILKRILSAVKKYYKSSVNELKIYNYILFNSWKYDEDDLYSVLDMLYQLQYDKDVHIEKIFDQLSLSLDMNLKDKFYLPKDDPDYVDKNRIEDFKLAMLGYSRHNIFDFLIDEKMLTADDVCFLRELIHEFELNDNNFDISCVRVSDKRFEQKVKEIWVPKTTNDFAMIINVHELTHAGVVGVSDMLVGYDVLNNDIPRFYEGVFKMKDDLIKREIEHTPLSKKLLDEYKEEPFLEQIEKYRVHAKIK